MHSRWFYFLSPESTEIRSGVPSCVCLPLMGVIQALALAGVYVDQGPHIHVILIEVLPTLLDDACFGWAGVT